VICLMTPESLYAIGLWYEDFSQTTDEDVCNLLAQSVNFGTAHKQKGAS
ncbi:MAG: phosphoribosyltransferase, partial [Acidobacteriota bacterium]